MARSSAGGNRLSDYLSDGILDASELGSQLCRSLEPDIRPSDVSEIYITGNHLESLPSWLMSFVFTQYLDLTLNSLLSLPDWLAEFSELRQLDLAGNRLESLPEALKELPQLNELYLANNRLRELPEWLSELNELRQLNVKSNLIMSLPSSIFQMKALTELDLSHNRLSDLPEAIDSRSPLRSLDFGDNQIRKFPESLCNLSKLTELSLRYNQLEQLPDELGRLASLRHLDLGSNNLTSLPSTIGRLTSLQTLELSHNKLRDLPYSLLNLRQLSSLDVSQNELPPEIMAASETQELSAYLRALEVDQIVIRQAKLILVGEGEAGKSTLLAALRDEPFIPDRKATHGMHIKPVTIKDEEGELLLHAWDFGGQPQYRPTHQLFFSELAIYLLVWRPRVGPGVGQISYWIDQIRQRAGADARIIVVASHADDPHSPPAILDEGTLLATYSPSIVAFIHVGSRDGLRLNDLKRMILDVAAEMPHTRRLMPSTWLATRAQLMAYQESHLTFAQFKEVAEANGLDNDADVSALARIGHTLGWWTHYAHHADLRDLVILSGQWLSTAISLIIDDNVTRSRHGFLPFQRAREIWLDEDRPARLRYPEHLHVKFLALMSLFDIAYKVAGADVEDPVSLVPELLPPARPNIESVWASKPPPDEARAFCRLLIKGTDQVSIPDAILPRLITRNHRLSLGAQDINKAVHWRTGVLLKNRYETYAFVELQAAGISIAARGPLPGGLVRQLVEGVRDLLNDYWPGLTSEILLPCPACRWPRIFILDHLFVLVRRGDKTMSCHRCHQSSEMQTIVNHLAVIDGESRTFYPASEVTEILRNLEEQTALNRETLRQLQELRTQSSLSIKWLGARLETEVSRLMRGLADEAKNGPRLFTMRPLPRTINKPQVTHVAVQVTLYCEYSRQPVAVLDGDPKSGVFEIDVPRSWWTRAEPWLRRTGWVLSFLTPISGAALRLGTSEEGWNAIEDPERFASEIANTAAAGLKALGSGAESGESVLREDPIAPVDGALLREFHQLLKDNLVGFGDLRLVLSNSGWLWVHRSFVHYFS
jgi:GTPase SAR1 family protein